MKSILLSILILISLSGVAQVYNPCSTIDKQVDDLRGFTSYSSPIDHLSAEDIWFEKVIEPKKNPVYYVNLRVNEPLGKSVQGAYILLKNGRKISRPKEDIDVDVDSEKRDILHPGFKQSVTLKLSSAELLLLKSSPIKKFAISYMEPIDINGDNLYNTLLCLITRK